MAKQQRTICICDRCNVEHQGTAAVSYNVFARTSGGFTLVDWKDLCPACSIQIRDILKGLIIHG